MTPGNPDTTEAMYGPVDDTVQRLEKALGDTRLSRRDFLRNAILLGMSLTSASAFLTACGGDGEPPLSADTPAASPSPPAPELGLPNPLKEWWEDWDPLDSSPELSSTLLTKWATAMSESDDPWISARGGVLQEMAQNTYDTEQILRGISDVWNEGTPHVDFKVRRMKEAEVTTPDGSVSFALAGYSFNVNSTGLGSTQMTIEEITTALGSEDPPPNLPTSIARAHTNGDPLILKSLIQRGPGEQIASLQTAAQTPPKLDAITITLDTRLILNDNGSLPEKPDLAQQYALAKELTGVVGNASHREMLRARLFVENIEFKTKGVNYNLSEPEELLLLDILSRSGGFAQLRDWGEYFFVLPVLDQIFSSDEIPASMIRTESNHEELLRRAEKAGILDKTKLWDRTKLIEPGAEEHGGVTFGQGNTVAFDKTNPWHSIYFDPDINRFVLEKLMGIKVGNYLKRYGLEFSLNTATGINLELALGIFPPDLIDTDSALSLGPLSPQQFQAQATRNYEVLVASATQ